MPGIDFAKVRVLVSRERVLELLGFVASATAGEQVRGQCPVHRPSSAGSRSLSANLKKHTFRCFKCGAAGNQLDLWMAVTGLPIHEAARELCWSAGVEVPKVRRKRG